MRALSTMSKRTNCFVSVTHTLAIADGDAITNTSKIAICFIIKVCAEGEEKLRLPPPPHTLKMVPPSLIAFTVGLQHRLLDFSTLSLLIKK